MYIVKEYPDGLFAWVDLQTPDVEGAKAFYGGLFGWELDDRPTDGGPPYTMALIEGHNTAGMMPMPSEMAEQGVPAFWVSYVKHSNVDSVVEKATAAGATIMMPAMDVMEEGRMALFQDPTGAMIGIWQPANHIGAEVVNSPNSLVWNELMAHDTDTAREFYKTVFGWTDSVDESGYIAFAQDGRVQAGGMAISPEMGKVPPNWSVYFLVEDMDTAVARVKELGGTVINGPFPAGTMGPMAVVSDPQGGVFNIIQINEGGVDAPPGA